MKIKVYLIFVVTFYCSVLFSQWEYVGFEDFLMKEIGTQNDSLYVGSSKIIFRSLDYGQTWDSLFTFGSSYIDCIYLNDDYLFVGLSRGLFELDTLPSIYRSHDKGMTWDLIYETTYGVYEILSFNKEIYAISNTSLIVSQDNGNTWEVDYLPGNQIQSLVSNDTTLFVGTRDGALLRKTINNLEWEVIGEELPDYTIYEIEAIEDTVVINSDSIYISTDNGLSWENINHGLTDETNHIYILNGNIFIDTFSNEVYFSKLSSINWKNVSEGLNVTGFANITDINTTENYVFLTSVYDGVWKRPISEITSDIEHSQNVNMIKKLFLKQNYPNPFNPVTTFEYTILNSGYTTIEVYNLLGERIKYSDKGFQKAGNYIDKLNFEEFTSGIYLLKVNSGDYSDQISIQLLK